MTPEREPEHQHIGDDVAGDKAGEDLIAGNKNSTYYYQHVTVEEIRRTRELLLANSERQNQRTRQELTEYFEQAMVTIKDRTTAAVMSAGRWATEESQRRAEAIAAERAAREQIGLDVASSFQALAMKLDQLTQATEARAGWCGRCTLGLLVLVLLLVLGALGVWLYHGGALWTS